MPLLFALPKRPLDTRQWTQKAAAPDAIRRDNLAPAAWFSISTISLRLSEA